jgi:hypothetical protein
MQADAFERFALHNTQLCVSVCRTCLQFIAAAPDPMRLAIAEVSHHCSRARKKPPTSVLSLASRTRSTRL